MIKFGTDGWRAIIGEEFIFANVERVVQAYADVMLEADPTLPSKPPIIIGFDRRFLSEESAQKIASVLAGNGISVLLSQDYCPTPCISWMSKTTKAPGGVMVTASHNPFPWNGIKFKEGYGGSASPAFTEKVEQKIEQNNKENRTPITIPLKTAIEKKLVVSFDPFKDYVQQLRSQLDIEKIKQANWKIAFDPLFGSGTGYLQKILGISIHEIHSEFNPSFGRINPEPIGKNLGPLMEEVARGKFDVGLATDGDADRIGAVDEKGNFVNSHQIMTLILRHLIEKGLTGEVVKTVSTTQMVDLIAAKHNIKVHEMPIGFKHICTKFLEINPLLGGEESGGIALPNHVYERDGLLSGLMLLEIMSFKKKRLGELLDDLAKEIGPFYFKREDVHLERELIEKFREKSPNINQSKIGNLKVDQCNRKDGLKFLLENNSWLLIRPSGTEPLVRIYAEGNSPALVDKLIHEGLTLLTE